MARESKNIPINSLWIFCEGETERNYFNQLKAEERIRGLKIRPKLAEDKKIKDMVDYSIKHLEHNRDYLEGDIVVYVFDRDENTNEDFKLVKAMDFITDPKLQLILSNPCFEFWILSHFELYTQSIEPKKLKIKLRKHMGSYKKTDVNIYNNTKKDIDTAVNNSKKAHKIQINKNGILCEESNPSTMMFQLIEMINHYKE